ncbi:MAG TPA: RDD family protein [Pseudomonadales bacterium]
MQVDLTTVKFAGFWSRLLAAVLDSIIQLLVLVPLFLVVFGPDIMADTTVLETPLGYTLNYGLPLLYVVVCWIWKSATPGKIMMGMAIVDADSGGKPPALRLVVRYVAYYISALPLFIGFLWVAFDRRKQGFHDKLARTVVVMVPPRR